MFDLISCFNLYLAYTQVQHDVLLDIPETSPPLHILIFTWNIVEMQSKVEQSRYNSKLKELIRMNVLLLRVHILQT